MKLTIYLFMVIMLVGLGSATITFDGKISELTDFGQYQYLYAGTGNGTNTTQITSHQTAWTLPAVNFQLFENGSVNQTWIWFGWSRGLWHNLSINITTAVNSTGLNLTWQRLMNTYADSESDWEDINIIEDTCGTFNQTGICNVNWEINENLKDQYMGKHPFKIRGLIIRAKVNGNATVYNGGFVSNIDGNDYAIKIPDGDDVETEDIYEASINGNWSMVDRMNDYYYIKTNVALVGRWLINDNELVQLGNLTTKRLFLRDDLSEFQIGLKDAYGMTYESSVFKYYQWSSTLEPYDYWYGNNFFYNSMILSYKNSLRNTALAGVLDIQNSIWEHMSGSTGGIFYIQAGAIGLLKNFIISKVSVGYFYSGNVEMDNVVISKYPIYTPQRNLFLNRGDLKNMDLTYPDNQLVGFARYGHDTADIIDCNIGEEENYTKYVIPISETSIGLGGRVKYTFTLDIKNDTGGDLNANVTLIDAHGNTHFNGTFSKNETIIPVYYIVNEVNGSGSTVQNKYYYNPFTLTVESEDYGDYNATFDITYKNRYFTLLAQEGGGFTTANALIIRKGEPSIEVKQCT